MLGYRLLASFLAPLIVLQMLLRCITGRERLADLAERLGRGAALPGPGPVIWLHAASNGELASARRLLGTILERAPDAELIVTTNTPTARALARDTGHPRIHAELAPIDHRAMIAAFLARWHPRALVTVESELWPNRFDLCRTRRLPVVLVGGRMSERAARRWSRRPALSLAVADAIRFLSAQDDISERRFRALGVTNERVGPVVSLKAVSAMPEAAPPAPPPAPLPFPRDLTILAASTHEGEEAIVLDAFLVARRERPGLRLILAPRHPARRGDIQQLLRNRKLAFRTRSAGQEPDAAAPVYLADTMGEMARWYASSGVTFVGGSLVDRGGHTPFEPAAAGSAILHGPFVSNFDKVYRALDNGHGAIRVDSAASLAARMAALADPARQAASARAARRVLADHAAGDGFEAILSALADATGIRALDGQDGS
jgi:3-deoxy-D-manno-octulosonic-acid transferase